MYYTKFESILKATLMPTNRTRGARGGSKQLLKEKLSAFEKKSHNRFELTDKFLKANISNMELANEKTNEENLHLFKKVGSNFQIKDRTVLFEPRGAWKTLLDSEFGGGNSLVSARSADPILHSETLFEKLRRRASKLLCLRVGFERRSIKLPAGSFARWWLDQFYATA